MNNENTLNLLARVIAGDASEEEVKELLDLLESDPGLDYMAKTFSGTSNALPIKQTGQAEVKKLLDHIRSRKKCEKFPKGIVEPTINN